MKTKILSAALAAAMLLTAIPSVYAEDEMTGITTTVASDYVGNIFFDKTPVELKVGFKNNDSKDIKRSASYTITDGEGRVIKTGELSVDLKGGEEKTETISLGVLDYDTYMINITSNDKTESFRFSSAVMSKSQNSDDSFGVCTHLGRYPEVIEPVTGLIDKAGITWNRDEYYWDGVEKEKGVFEFNHDEYIDAMTDKGNNSLIILDYGNPLYGGTPHDEVGYKAFAEYCRKMAEHFKGRVDTFEIWNEWNGSFGSGYGPETYAYMFKEASAAVKETNPDAYIVACATADVDMGWIKTVLDITGIDMIDAISIHPYAYPASPESGGLKSNIKKVHDMAKQYGKDVDVWCTEMGYPSADGIIDETTAGAYKARVYVYSKSLSGRDKLFLYDFQNDGVDRTNGEHNFGMIRAKDDNVPMAAKKGYLAIANATNILGDAEFETVSDDEDNIQVYKFKKGSEGILAIWTLSSAENVGINVGCDEVTVTDWLGNQKIVKTQNGAVTILANEKPVYISGNFNSYKVEKPGFDTAEKKISAAKGENVAVRFDRGTVLPGKSGKISAKLPEGISMVSNSEFGSDGEIAAELAVNDDVANGDYRVEFKIESNGEYLGSVGAGITVVEESEIKAAPVLYDRQGFSKWGIEVSVTNNSRKKDISGKLVVTEPEEYAGIEIKVPTLGFGESFTGTIDPKTAPENKLIPLVLKLETSDGETKEYKREISCLAAVRAKNNIKIDGVAEENEWDDAMKFCLDDISQIHGYKGQGELEEYGGEGDLSGFGYLKWDNDNFYMMVKVKDDIHIQTSSGSGIWQGDGLQFCIDPSRGEKIGKNDWHEIGIVVTNEGDTHMWKWLSIPGIAGGEVKDYVGCAKRNEDDKTVTYEVQIPWKQLLPLGTTVSPNRIIGFSVIANEDDGKGRDGWIQYMSGIGSGKDAHLFGDVILLDDAKTVSDAAYPWADKAANVLIGKGVISENYSGAKKLTAGEFAEILSKAMKIDMDKITYDGFEKDKTITRQDMVVMLDKACADGTNADAEVLKAFLDNDKISDYAIQSFANMVAKGIIAGNGTMLYPQDDTVLAEAAVAVYNIVK